MSKIINRHYTECGLPNIWIRCKCVIDDAERKAYIIPNINALHKEIARLVVNSDGALTGAEIKFLRSEIGWTQTQLGEIVHRQRLTISRWESGKSMIDGAADAFIRMLAIDKLKLKKAAPEEISRRYRIRHNAKDSIQIDEKDSIQNDEVESGQYRLVA